MTASPSPTLAEQQRYWDHRWQGTEAPNAWSRRRGDAILAWLRSLPLDRPKILDLGCGTGWFTAQLAQYGEATGVDLSEAAIAAARERYPQVGFLAGDLFQLSLPPASFEVVVSQEVIAHVADQPGYIEGAARLLKPGGYLLVTTANRFIMERVDWPPQPLGHIEQWLSMKELQRLLRPRFRILRATSILPMGHRGLLRVLNSHKLNAVFSRLISPAHLDALKGWAGLGYTLIVLAQKSQRAPVSVGCDRRGGPDHDESPPAEKNRHPRSRRQRQPRGRSHLRGCHSTATTPCSGSSAVWV